MKPVSTLIGHAGAVNAIAFSSDGEQVASGGMDRNVHVWNVGRGDVPVETFEGLKAPVRHILFLDGAKHLMAVGQDGHCLVWERTTKVPAMEVVLDQIFLVQVAISSNGQTLAAALSDGMITMYKLSLPGVGAEVPAAPKETDGVPRGKSSDKTKHTKITPAQPLDIT